MPETSAFHIPHSPVAALGTIVLLVAFALAAYTAAVGLIGSAQHRPKLVKSSIYGMWAFTGLITLATSLIVYAFLTHDFTIKYVALNSDSTMPFWYKITAYWGGLDGSLMFWVFMLAVFAAIAVFVNRERHKDMMGWVIATIMAVELFFMALLIYDKNPFATFLTEPPTDGKGLNPLLQTYWMVIHPPSLYTGFVAATIPFAFGIGALASGRLDDAWLKSMRSWMVVCWFFLSFGLILGGRWAYEELGWGGYWAWDPVENAGFLPWFTATAFLHSVIIQEQRGMMKVWNVVLVVTTFFLTIFGTFMTRSGIVQSVHAFGEDNQLAMLFILFMAVILIISFGLILFRLPALRSVNSFDSFYSREFAFLLNNWILLGCAVFVLFATMFPTLSEAIDGQRRTVGIPFFNQWMTPLGLVLVFLAGAAPLLAWRRTTRERLVNQLLFPFAAMTTTIAVVALVWPRWQVRTAIFSDKIELPIALVNFGIVAFTLAACLLEFYKGARVRRRQTGSDPVTSLIGVVLAKRRTYGGYLIHMAICVMFIGFAGKAVETEQDVTVRGPGDTFKVGPYHFFYEVLADGEDDNKKTWTATVHLWKGDPLDEAEAAAAQALARAGKPVDIDRDLFATMKPARWQFNKLPDQPTTEVAIETDFPDDVYLVLTGFSEKDKPVNFRIFLNPLINWVWLGFGFLAFGTVIILIPERTVRRLSPRRQTRAGRLAEGAVVLLILGGVTAGMVRAAQAQAPSAEQLTKPPPPLHDEGPIGMGAAHAGDNSASLYRPDSPTAAKLMKDLICTCGGCARETLHACKCGFAAEERKRVLGLLAGRDLSTDEARQSAYDDVMAAFVAERGEDVRGMPKSNLAWLVPYVVVAGALMLLGLFGRRWVKRGRLAQVEASRRADRPAEGKDEDYAAELDDELRDID